MKFVITRDIAVKVNWILDNLIPPVLRDLKPLMRLVEYVIYGRKGEIFLNFKENGRYLHMEPDEIRQIYQAVSDASSAMTRPTDLNRIMEQKILSYFFTIRKKGKKVHILDIACGRGYLTKKLAGISPDFEVYGMDILLPKSLEKLENMHFIQGEIERIPFPAQYFDIVVCTYTLEHVTDLEKALEELRRVCRKRLIVAVPCEREYQYTTNLHTYWFPYEHTVRRLFHNADAKVYKWGGDFLYIERIVQKETKK